MARWIYPAPRDDDQRFIVFLTPDDLHTLLKGEKVESEHHRIVVELEGRHEDIRQPEQSSPIDKTDDSLASVARRTTELEDLTHRLDQRLVKWQHEHATRLDRIEAAPPEAEVQGLAGAGGPEWFNQGPVAVCDVARQHETRAGAVEDAITRNAWTLAAMRTAIVDLQKEGPYQRDQNSRLLGLIEAHQERLDRIDGSLAETSARSDRNDGDICDSLRNLTERVDRIERCPAIESDV